MECTHLVGPHGIQQVTTEVSNSEPNSSQIGAVSVLRFPGEVPDPVVLGSPNFYQKEGLILPKKGLTVMYGHRGSSNVLRASMLETSDSGSLAIVSFKVNVGRWNPNKQKLEDLEDSFFINLPSRSSSELMNDVNEKWNAWLAEEGKPPEKFPREASNNMYLLDRLIETPPYNNAVAIAFDVVTSVGAAKFMTIFDTSAIDIESVVVGPGLDVGVQI